MTRILVAPDKFKGSLSAAEVADAVRLGLRRADRELEVDCVPVADGGDGTLEAALAAGYERVEMTATGPTGATVRTAYGRRGDVAVVEMATVSGLERLPDGERQALTATSRGTGELVAAALEDGCRRVMLGIGGSASTDGGAGMLQALGARLLDAHGNEIGAGGAALADLRTVDLTGMVIGPARAGVTTAGESRPVPAGEVEIVVACDVDNPLTGEHGAAAVYGPQKGAGAAEVRTLDTNLSHFADLVAQATGRDLRDAAGAGAAGGVGYAAIAVLGATLRPGIELVLEIVDFDAGLAGADLVIVGEGSLDEQTLRGKAPVGVASAATKAGTEVVAVCGRCTLDDDQLRGVGIAAAYALTDLEPDPAVSMAEAGRLLEKVAERIVHEHLSGRG